MDLTSCSAGPWSDVDKGGSTINEKATTSFVAIGSVHAIDSAFLSGVTQLPRYSISTDKAQKLHVLYVHVIEQPAQHVIQADFV